MSAVDIGSLAAVQDKDRFVYIRLKEIDMRSRGVLRRSRSNRWVAGVCGGLAEFFGISSFWFRLAFLILLIPGGLPGLIPYLVMVLVIPSE